MHQVSFLRPAYSRGVASIRLWRTIEVTALVAWAYKCPHVTKWKTNWRSYRLLVTLRHTNLYTILPLGRLHESALLSVCARLVCCEEREEAFSSMGSEIFSARTSERSSCRPCWNGLYVLFPSEVALKRKLQNYNYHWNSRLEFEAADLENAQRMLWRRGVLMIGIVMHRGILPW